METGVLGAQWTHCENGPWDKLATGQSREGGGSPRFLAKLKGSENISDCKIVKFGIIVQFFVFCSGNPAIKQV